MQDQPLVSVLMTAYNREKYIAEAIDSVLASTYQNWELIIVDDQSQDRTVEIAKSYEKKDKRIKLYINVKNLGDYPNRNQAAKYASGKYIKYLDADDLLYPHGLEILVYNMEKFPDAGYGLCSLPQDNHRIYPFELLPSEAYKRHYIEGKWIFHKAPLSSIIKKNVFDEVGGFSGKRMVGDFEMWHILSRNYNVVLLPSDIVWYREHCEGEMQYARDNVFQMFEYLLLEYELLIHKENPMDDIEKKYSIENCLKKKARFILRNFVNMGFKKGNSLRKKAKMRWIEVFKLAFK